MTLESRHVLTFFCETCGEYHTFSVKSGEKVLSLLGQIYKHKSHKIDINVEKVKKTIANRTMINWMEHYHFLDLSKPLNAIEIGVADGRNALEIIQSFNIKTLYLIDPYISYKEDNREYDYSKEENKMKKLLRPHMNSIIFFKDFSENVADKISDNSIDFVYIDGNHQYEYVKKDIELYYPKVKVGGIIGGHDFCTDTIGVIKAVLEFADKHKIIKIMEKKNAGERDWWIIKT